MSNGAAIAAVTAALRNLLSEAISQDPDLADTAFTMQSPDIARADGGISNQLNLFLFRTAVNPAWSNGSISNRVRSGEDASPPLALSLSYLLTAYGRDNDAQRPFSHLLLGRAMGVLHDNPILTPEALRASLPETGALRQIERVRLTLQPMSLDDLSKLWSGFQTQFRLSTTYEASVVLIESLRPIRAPLPVLKRSATGGGVITYPDALGPMPLLVNLHPATVGIGDTVTLQGIHLANKHVVVRLTRDGRSWDLPVAPGSTAEKVDITIPADRDLGAGLHSARIILGKSDRETPSNVVPLAIMPRIVSHLPMTVHLKAGAVQVVIEVLPPVLPGQFASLLLGSREVLGPTQKDAQKHLRFNVVGIDPGNYVLRLRVDGIDSQTVQIIDGAQPQFDPAARLTVTA